MNTKRNLLIVIASLLLAIIIVMGLLVRNTVARNANDKVESATKHALQEWNDDNPESINRNQTTDRNDIAEESPDSEERIQVVLLHARYCAGGLSATLSPNGNISYHPKNLFDGELSSCWAIDQKSLITDPGGRGIDCLLLIKTAPCTIYKIVIYNGYQKNKDVFNKNCRPKGILITYGDEDSKLVDGTIFEGELQDRYGPQTIFLDEPVKIPNGKVINLYVNPDNIFKGSKYTDICLSEVQLYGTVD